MWCVRIVFGSIVGRDYSAYDTRNSSLGKNSCTPYTVACVSYGIVLKTARLGSD